MTRYIAQLPWLTYALIALVLTVVCSVIYRARVKKHLNAPSVFLLFLTIAYTLLFCLVFLAPGSFPLEPCNAYQLKPFHTVSAYVAAENYLPLALKALAFAPIPLLLRFCKTQWSMKRVMGVSLLLAAAVEPYQAFLNAVTTAPTKMVNVDDALLALLGCAVGGCILLLLNRCFHKVGRRPCAS